MLNEIGGKSSFVKGGSGGARALKHLPVTVLHIDDDPNDTELLRAAAQRANLTFALQNAEDAEHAMAYLSGAGVFGDRTLYPLPSLILLDLKLPRATGFEILKWIRHRPEFKRLPVVVLSGSQLKDDMQHAYEIGADSYMIKPLGFEELVRLVKGLNTAWLPISGK